jgi:hypothetical protein
MFKKLWKSAYRYRGAFVIVLYQAVPVGTDSLGRTRVGIGAGASTLEYASFDCNGDVLGAQTGKTHNVGVEVEHHFDKRVSVHAAATHQTADSISERGSSFSVTAGYDRRFIGFHGGLTSLPSGSVFLPRQMMLPSATLRVGDYQRFHARFEVFPASVVTFNEPVRVLLGWNQYDPTRPSGAVGLSWVGAFEQNGSQAFVGEFFIPGGNGLQIGAHGFLGKGAAEMQSGINLEVKKTFW